MIDLGYYTRYSLDVEAETIEQAYSAIASLRRNSSSAEYALDYAGNSGESCKWYNHEENLVDTSFMFPDVKFTLSGEGEEAGDIWKLYVINGKTERVRAKVTFDESTLFGL